jgi:hypothetical protein
MGISMKTVFQRTAHRLLITGILIALTSVSLLLIINSNPDSIVQNQYTYPSSESAPNYANINNLPIIGTGTNHSVRVDLINTGSQECIDDINISSSSNEEYLTFGQFNLTIHDTLTTTYEIEDDNSLELPQIRYNGAGHNLTVSDGTYLSGTDDNIKVDTDFVGYQANGNNLVVNISGYLTGSPTYTELIGLISNLKIGLNCDVLVNASLYESGSSTWGLVLENFKLNSSGAIDSPSSNTLYLRNENNRYINSTLNYTISLSFYNNSITNYIVRFYRVEISGAKGFELPILNSQYAALEFDTKGHTIIHGFYVWIRSTNVTNPGNLTLSLVNSTLSSSIPRSSLLDKTLPIKATPKINESYYDKTINNFASDRPIWIDFDADVELEIGNYFIVLRSNNTWDIKHLSLVVLPDTQAGSFGYDNDPVSPRVDHLLLQNSTGLWKYVDLDPIVGPICDAAPFSLNLTRAWNPTELNLSLQIDNAYYSISGAFNYNYSIDTSGKYGTFWWGLGTINHSWTFTELGIQAKYMNFSIPLSWRTDLVPNLNFTLNYFARKYVIENATTIYNLKIDEKPTWNSTFNLVKAKYGNWNISGIIYYYSNQWVLIDSYDANDFSARNFFQNLTFGTQNSTVLYAGLIKEYGDNYFIDGAYTFISESPNYITKNRLYLKFKDNIWETSGFMPGDEITSRIGIKSPTGAFVNSGFVNISFYSPANALLNSSVDNDVDLNTDASWYEFSRFNLLNTTNLTEGNYSVTAFWSNGEQAGIIAWTFYIGQFNTQTPIISTPANMNITQFQGLIDIAKTNLENYDLYLYSTRALTQTDYDELAGNYLVNNSYDLDLGYGIRLVKFAQNETIFNAGQKVSFKIEVKNTNNFMNFNVSVVVNIISTINSKWVIANASSVSKIIEFSGVQSGNDTIGYDVELDIPDQLTGGVNSPIRHAPMQIKIDVKINDLIISNQIFNEKYLYIENSSYHGTTMRFMHLADRFGRPYIANIEREYMNLPGMTNFYIQATNRYGQSISSDRLFVYDDSIRTRIENFTADPNINVNKTSILNFSGYVINELNKPVANIPISFSAWNKTGDGELAMQLNSGGNILSTNINGYFTGLIAMNQFEENQFFIKASWDGNLSARINGFSQNISVLLNSFESDMNIEFVKSKLVVNGINLISITLINSGNSTMYNLSVAISSSSEFRGEILNVASLKNSVLRPGQNYSLQVKLWQNSFLKENALIFFIVSGAVNETGQNFTKEYDEVFQVYRTNENSLQFVWGMIGYIAILTIVWVASVYYIRKQYRAMNQIGVTDEKPGKPKGTPKGKYINLADLSKEKPKPVDQKTEETTLDDLIQEESKK